MPRKPLRTYRVPSLFHFLLQPVFSCFFPLFRETRVPNKDPAVYVHTGNFKSSGAQTTTHCQPQEFMSTISEAWIILRRQEAMSTCGTWIWCELPMLAPHMNSGNDIPSSLFCKKQGTMIRLSIKAQNKRRKNEGKDGRQKGKKRREKEKALRRRT